MHRIQVNEYTALLRIRVFHTGGAYTLNIESGNNVKAPRQYVFRGNHDSFVRFLMGIKAKDNKTWPRSVRGERYSDIADEIENGTDQIIYVWEHDFMRYINKKRTQEKTYGKLKNSLELAQWASDTLDLDMTAPSFILGDDLGIQFINSSFKTLDPEKGLSTAYGFRIYSIDECVTNVFYDKDIAYIIPSDDGILIKTRRGYTVDIRF